MLNTAQHIAASYGCRYCAADNDCVWPSPYAAHRVAQRRQHGDVTSVEFPCSLPSPDRASLRRGRMIPPESTSPPRLNEQSQEAQARTAEYDAPTCGPFYPFPSCAPSPCLDQRKQVEDLANPSPHAGPNYWEGANQPRSVLSKSS